VYPKVRGVSSCLGHAVAQVVSHWLLTTEAQVHAQVSLCGICSGQSGAETGLSQISLVFSFQYHSADAPYSFIYHLEDRQWAH
jgi:hypothetical protein